MDNQNAQSILDNEEQNRLAWEAKTEGMPGFTVAQLRVTFDRHQSSKRWKDAFLSWATLEEKDSLVAAIAYFLGDKAQVSGPIGNGHRVGQYIVETDGYQCD